LKKAIEDLTMERRATEEGPQEKIKMTKGQEMANNPRREKERGGGGGQGGGMGFAEATAESEKKPKLFGRCLLFAKKRN